MKHNPEIKAEAISRHFDKKESVDAIVNDIGITGLSNIVSRRSKRVLLLPLPNACIALLKTE